MPRIKWTALEQKRVRDAHNLKKKSQTTVEKISESNRKRFEGALKKSPFNHAYWTRQLYSISRYNIILALKRMGIKNTVIRKELLTVAKTLAITLGERVQKKKIDELFLDAEANGAVMVFNNNVKKILGKKTKQFFALMDEQEIQILP